MATSWRADGMNEATDATAGTAEGEREIPPPEELTHGQYAGTHCVWCARPIWEGGQYVGVTLGQSGAHDLDAPVYAGPCCL
jgi:hypothetical protein